MKKIIVVLAATLLLSVGIVKGEGIFEDLSTDEQIAEMLLMIEELTKRIEVLESELELANDDKENEMVEEDTDTETSDRDMQNALAVATEWGERNNWSESEIERKLVEWEYFPEDAAKYAIENVEIDYKENALNVAQEWADRNNWSDSEIKRKLIEWEYFTEEEADYAMENLE